MGKPAVYMNRESRKLLYRHRLRFSNENIQ